MVIDHIGIVVRSLADGIQQWVEVFGYQKNSDVVVNTRQKVNVVFLAKQGSLPIKLVEPTDPTSPVFQFARKGGGLHHVCFRCSSMETQIPALRERGCLLVVPPQPGEAFNNHDIAFLQSKNNLSIELIDTEEKKGVIKAQ
jgi:methylmalonyl-CoA/ethylmalonyl-CoA epimerase